MISLCNTTITLGSSAQVLIIAMGPPCILIAIFNAVAFFSMRLYTKTIYRLLLYKMISETVLSLMMSAGAIKYEHLPLMYVDAIVIFMIGASTILSNWLAIHVFVFAVCYKNPKALEPLYVATTVLICTSLSALYIAAVSLAPTADGCIANIAMGGACIVLTLGLLLSSATFMATLVTVMHRRWCVDGSPYKRQYKTTLQETIPFALYPSAYFLLLFPLLILSAHHVLPITRLKSTHDFRYVLPQVFCLLGCVLLMAHLVAVRFIQKCDRKPSMISRLEAQNGAYGSIQF